jgi:hypothetical protein
MVQTQQQGPRSPQITLTSGGPQQAVTFKLQKPDREAMEKTPPWVLAGTLLEGSFPQHLPSLSVTTHPALEGLGEVQAGVPIWKGLR